MTTLRSIDVDQRVEAHVSTAAEVNVQRIADGPANIAAAAAVPGDLNARIEAAFSDGAATPASVAAPATMPPRALRLSGR